MRVSTLDQNLDLQEDALKKEGCEKIYQDKISGSLSKFHRAGLSESLEYLREGDILVVYKLDRLGRSLKDLIEIVNDLGERKIGFKSISESIDTTTANGKLIFHIFGAISEFERELIRERTKSGLVAARSRGRVGGRPKKINAEKIKIAKQLDKNKSLAISEILPMLQVSKSTYHRMVKSADVDEL